MFQVLQDKPRNSSTTSLSCGFVGVLFCWVFLCVCVFFLLLLSFVCLFVRFFGGFFWSCLFWKRRGMDEEELMHKLRKFDRRWFYSKRLRELERIQDCASSWIYYWFFTTMTFSPEFHTFSFDILYLTVSVHKGALYYKHCQGFSVGFLEFFSCDSV